MVIRDRKKERRRSADVVVFPTDATFFVVVVAGKIEIISLLCFIQRERETPPRARARRAREREKRVLLLLLLSSREKGRESESESDARSTLSLSLSLSVSKFLEKTLDLFFD